MYHHEYSKAYYSILLSCICTGTSLTVYSKAHYSTIISSNNINIHVHKYITSQLIQNAYYQTTSQLFISTLPNILIKKYIINQYYYINYSKVYYQTTSSYLFNMNIIKQHHHTYSKSTLPNNLIKRYIIKQLYHIYSKMHYQTTLSYLFKNTSLINIITFIQKVYYQSA